MAEKVSLTAPNAVSPRGAKVRKWLRWIHRDLSFVFAGMLLVYAISGIALNHKDSFNSQYAIHRSEHALPPTPRSEVSPMVLAQWLQQCGVAGQEIQHYFPDETTLKVFLRGNSSLTVNLQTGTGILEQVRKRPILGSLSRLHYNPGKAWTWFSDIFAVAMVVIVLTGLFMLRGKHSLIGIGGIEFLIGVLIPLLFVLL